VFLPQMHAEVLEENATKDYYNEANVKTVAKVRKHRTKGPPPIPTNNAELLRLNSQIFFMSLVNMMCKTAQRWERLLYATGGALNLLKCFWYGVQWSFTAAGVPRMEKIKDNDPAIALSSGADFNKMYNIQHIETTKGMRTLGVHLAPDGNDLDEFKYRMDEATMIQDRLKVGAPLF
jgi:hypothetical protein